MCVEEEKGQWYKYIHSNTSFYLVRQVSGYKHSLSAQACIFTAELLSGT